MSCKRAICTRWVWISYVFSRRSDSSPVPSPVFVTLGGYIPVTIVLTVWRGKFRRYVARCLCWGDMTYSRALRLNLCGCLHARASTYLLKIIT